MLSDSIIQQGEITMNIKQKLGYMFIGCLFTIAGYIIASLGGDTSHAQQGDQVIDKIVCRELEVVDKAGKRVVSIGATEKGGGMVVFNTAEEVVVEIGVGEHGGIMEVLNNAGKGGVGIITGEHGGGIKIGNKNKKIVVDIGSTEDGSGDIRTYKGGLPNR